jgi:hypothetical protein
MANRSRTATSRGDKGARRPKSLAGPRTRELADAAQESLQDLRLACRLQLEGSPYLTLGSTFALGWILGGGVPFGVVRWALGMSARIATTSVVHAALKDATEVTRKHLHALANGSRMAEEFPTEARG